MPGLTGTTQVAIGLTAGFALRSNGTVSSWGSELNGVLGNTCNFIGKVMRQNPAAGSVVSAGSAVAVTVGARPPTPCP